MVDDVIQGVFENPEAAVEQEKKRRGRPKKSDSQDDTEEAVEAEVEESMSLAEATALEVLDDTLELTPELEKYREEVRNQIKTMRDSFWFVGEAFVRIRNEKLFKTWGYKNFNDYVEQECDYSRSSAFNLMKTYEYFKNELKSKLSGSEEQYALLVETVKEVGWAKASKLAQEQVVTSETVVELIDALKDLTVNELETRCKKIRNDLPEKEQQELRESNDTKTIKKNFQLTLYEADVVETALNKAKSMLKQGAKDSKALAFVCGDFDSSNAAAEGEVQDVQSYISKVETLLGIDLIAVSREGDKIIYGHGTLERLAAEPETLAEPEFDDAELVTGEAE